MRLRASCLIIRRLGCILIVEIQNGGLIILYCCCDNDSGCYIQHCVLDTGQERPSLNPPEAGKLAEFRPWPAQSALVTRKMHFNLFHTGMCAARALRQFLCGRLYISIPAGFHYIRLTVINTQILRWRSFDAHIPVFLEDKRTLGVLSFF